MAKRHLKLKHLTAFILAVLLLPVPLLVKADPQADFAAKEKLLTAKAAEVKSLSDEVGFLNDLMDTKTRYLADLRVQQEQAHRNLTAINADLTNMQNQRDQSQTQLERYVRAEYMTQPPNEYTVIAGTDTLAESVAGLSYISSLEGFTNQIVRRITQIERQITIRQDKAKTDYQVLNQAESQARKEQADLQSAQAAKRQLLSDTQGQAERFRQDFEAAREELVKMGLFARSARNHVGSRVWDDSGWYFNQLDTRWVDAKLGFSDTSTIGDYGCGVTALAMVYKYYGIHTDPIQLNESLKQSGAFISDMLDWRNVAGASGGKLRLANSPYPLGAANVNWTQIDTQLGSGNPVIVYIDRGGGASHYVVLIAKQGDTYLMHDPVEGPYLRFSDYYRTDSVYQYITFYQN